MSSTFFGLSIGSSGLNAFHAAINTTANNISNVQTEGYSKQVTNLEASSALRVFQRYGTTGTGVTAKGVTQVRDLYYDEKYWNNQAKYGEYDKKLYYMEQIENYFTDSAAVEGFSRIYAKAFNALDTVSTNAGDTAVRNEFISDMTNLMTYFNTKGVQLQDLQSTINEEIKSTVDNVNSIIQKITSLNKQINVIELEGSHANELRDERAKLVDELSEIIPVEVREDKVINSNFEDMYTGATHYTVKLNGRLLVDTYECTLLDTRTRAQKDNQCDVSGLYDVVWSDSGAKIDMNAKSMTGALKALFQVRDGNNLENLRGTVTGAGTNEIKVSYPDTCKDIMTMNMPHEGTVTINSTEYAYNGFTFETDDQGNIVEYIFNTTEPLDVDTAGKLIGSQAQVGEGVDYKGIPYYQNQMSTFLRSFTKKFNELQRQGYDLSGNKMGSFFVGNHETDKGEYVFTDEATDAERAAGTAARTVDAGNAYTNESDTYYRLTALNADVADQTKDNPKIFATTRYNMKNDTEVDGKKIYQKDAGVDAFDLVTELQKLQKDVEIFRGSGGDGFLQCVYADVTVDTQQCTVFQENFYNIRETIDSQRTSVKGVDEDEEAQDLVKFQNAYNLSSKCIQVLSEMYDRLITQTGV